MKTIFATALFALLGAGAFAQTSQGTVVLSGSAGFSKSTQKNEDTQDVDDKTFNFTPSIGFLVQDGLEVGAAIGYSYVSSQFNIPLGWGETMDYNAVSNVYSFSPYVKKYFSVSEKFAFTGSALVGISTGSMEYRSVNSNGSESKLNGFQAALVPGVIFFPTEKIGISANFGNLGYSELTIKAKEGSSETKTSDFGFDLNSSTLGIGFSYYLSR